MELILASASPRRREILRAAGIRFEALPSSVEERRRRGEAPRDFVRRLAREKAEAVAVRLRRAHGKLPDRQPLVLSPRSVVLGADTEVVVDGRVLGKPASDAQAVRMLRLLSGREHKVMTGLCLLDPQTGRRRVALAVTKVSFIRLSEKEIRDYVRSGEPRDKAGAYAIQGRASKFVQRIEGCYFNVMGLPVAKLYRMLKEFGPQVGED